MIHRRVCEELLHSDLEFKQVVRPHFGGLISTSNYHREMPRLTKVSVIDSNATTLKLPISSIQNCFFRGILANNPNIFRLPNFFFPLFHLKLSDDISFPPSSLLLCVSRPIRASTESRPNQIVSKTR